MPVADQELDGAVVTLPAVGLRRTRESYSTRLGEIRQSLDQLVLVEQAADLSLLLDHFSKPGRPTIVSFLNAHAVNLAWKDRQFRGDLLDSDVLLRDGIGLNICLKILGRSAGLNLNGTDLIPQIVAEFRGKSVVLLGTRSPFLDQAAEVLARNYGVHVVGKLDGFRPAEEYVELVKAAKPALIVLAMGMPKQECVARLLRDEINRPCLIVNGGAVLDHLSSRVTRAPLWIRRIGMEWAFRLLLEPGRLWKRYLVGNITFLGKVLLLRMQKSLAAANG